MRRIAVLLATGAVLITGGAQAQRQETLKAALVALTDDPELRRTFEEGLAALMDGAPDIEMLEAPKMLGMAGIRRSTPLIARIP